MIDSLRTLILIAASSLAASLASGQVINANDPSLVYNGTWMNVADTNASAGLLMVSSTVGSSVTFTVNGTNFVLWRKMDTNGGYATVTVDGTNFGQLTFYAAQTVYQIPAAIDELPAGMHTIVLSVSQTQPNGSGGSNLYIDSLETPVPANLTATPAQLAAIAEMNVFRTLAGLPPARHHLALGLAANAHAQYLNDVNFISNGLDPHVETLGQSQYFTAAQPGDRDAYFGLTAGGGFEDSNNEADPALFVDSWMDNVYHRSPFLVYNLTDAGFGGYPNGSTMDFASAILQPAAPTATTMTVYPTNGQTNVWSLYDGTDGPNNVTPGSALGYPISAWFAFPANAMPGTATATPTTGTLVDASGNNIPVTIADPTTDNQLGMYVMIPNQALNAATTYTASMAGVDPSSNSFSQTWSFTTAPLNFVHSPRYNTPTGTYIYIVNWDMQSTTVPSVLNYGPTTAYGSTAMGTNSMGTSFQASLPGVVSQAVTHFQVVATDAMGNVFTTPDHTITIVTPLAPATVAFVQLNPSAADTNFQWETAGPVATCVVNYGADSTYGSMTSGNLFGGGATTQFSADIFNLTSGTYHYQITATDMQGNTFSTPDATFVIP